LGGTVPALLLEFGGVVLVLLLVPVVPVWLLELGATVVLVDCRSRWKARVS
jgi:hypothetical protein